MYVVDRLITNKSRFNAKFKYVKFICSVLLGLHFNNSHYIVTMHRFCGLNAYTHNGLIINISVGIPLQIVNLIHPASLRFRLHIRDSLWHSYIYDMRITFNLVFNYMVSEIELVILAYWSFHAMKKEKDVIDKNTVKVLLSYQFML